MSNGCSDAGESARNFEKMRKEQRKFDNDVKEGRKSPASIDNPYLYDRPNE